MKIYRGEIWMVRMDPSEGSEIKKTRPAVVLSRTDFNLLSETVTVIPVSSKRYISSFHVMISSLSKDSHVVIPQLRVASRRRFTKRVGKITPDEMKEIEDKMSFYFDMF